MNKWIKDNGNILIEFIMMIAISYIIFSFITLTSYRMTESRVRVTELQTFYVAEAGLNRAIWLLLTPSAEGGMGTYYRTTGVTQTYGSGRYTYYIANGAIAGEILIMSTGEVNSLRKTLLQTLSSTGVPDAFKYSVYGGSNVSLGTTYNIFGDMFVNGNTVFSGSGTNVKVYHSSGKTVSGGGVDGGVPNPLPQFPVLDTTNYTNDIAIAQTYAAGNVTYNNTFVNLNGGTLYINGSGTFSTVTFMGPGKIVATGNISFTNGPNGSNDQRITVISGANFVTSGNNSRLNNFTYYAQTSVALQNSYSGTGNVVLCNGNISTSGNVSVSGMIYSKTGSVTLANSTTVTGSIVAAAGVTATKTDLRITQDTSAFAANMPPGFPSERYSPKKGSWKEI